MRGIKAAFLPKKSEKARPAEKEEEAACATAEERAAEALRKAAERKARGNNGARRDMHFEIETKEETVAPEGVEGGVVIGVREAIRYEMVPPRFIKHLYHLQTVKAGGVIHSAKAPLSPLQNSSFDGSFIAGIAQLRYLYSMPVERIVDYFRANGFNLDKQTAHGLLKKTAGLFGRLHSVMRDAVREDSYLCCDETYHTVLVDAKANGGRGSRRGYVWAMAAVHSGLAYFFYDNGSRSQDVIMRELDGYGGTIQSDGLAAYKNVAARSSGRVLRLACLQHCRRPFLEDDIKDNPDAAEISRLVNGLYREEHGHCIGRDGWTEADNLRWRAEYAPPILKSLRSKLLRIQKDEAKYPPKSSMSRAVNYMLNEWDGIEAIFTGGGYHLDNNLIERLNRYISLSRHNSLFFGSHAGAERGCIFYSLACSCRLHKIDFFEYLSDVLNRTAALPNGAPDAAYRELLPDRWSKQQP